MNAHVKHDEKSALRRRGRTWSMTAALALACAAVAVPAAAHADPGTGTNLGQDNLPQANFVQDAAPPAGAQFALVVAQGGAGGGGFGLTGSSTAPGVGMNTSGYLPISGTSPLEVAVGQEAQPTPENNSIGGWGNGLDGGDGSVSLCSNDAWMSYSGGGGGATSIKYDGKLVLVAGGGGGGGGGNTQCHSADDAGANAGKGGDAGPTPQDGERGVDSDPLPDVLGGKAGGAPTSAGVSAGSVKNGNGPGGAGGGGVLGGDAGLGSTSLDAGLRGGGGGGAGTSMTTSMAGVTNAAGRNAVDGFVAITWYSDVSLAFTGAPSTTEAGTATKLPVTLTDPDGNQAGIEDGVTLTTGDPSDTIAGDSITFGDAGPRTVTATFGSQSTTTDLVVEPGAASAVQVGVPAYAYAGDTITPTLTLVDSEGNDVGPADNAEFFSDSAQDTINADGTITLQPGVSRTATITGQSVLQGDKVVRDQAQLQVTTDWAYKTKVTASSSLEAFGFGAQQLTDGDTSSSAGHHGFTTDPAVSTQDSDAWVEVDLGTNRTIGGVVVSPRTAVAPEPANGTDGAGYPQDFTIDVSDDGTTWTTAATYTGQTGMSGPHTYRFDQAVTGRYLRLNATLLGPFAEGDDGFRLQLAGLQVYADPAYPAPQSLDVSVSSGGSAVSVHGLDAYGAPTGQNLDCDVTVTSSDPSDEILPPVQGCSNAFGYVAGSDGPRTLTATLNSDPSVTGTVVYDSSIYAVQLHVAADPLEYGKQSVVHVTGEADTTPEGRVEVREGSTLLGAGDLAAGKVDLTLDGKALTPGRHDLTVRYLATDGHRSTSADLSVVVKKATTTMQAKVHPRRVVVRSTKAHVRVTATSLVGAPTGKVQARVSGQVVGEGTLARGKVTLTLDRFTRVGKQTVTLRYLGSSTHARAVVRVPILVHAASH